VFAVHGSIKKSFKYIQTKYDFCSFCLDWFDLQFYFWIVKSKNNVKLFSLNSGLPKQKQKNIRKACQKRKRAYNDKIIESLIVVPITCHVVHTKNNVSCGAYPKMKFVIQIGFK
jgi:hypothetical protein